MGKSEHYLYLFTQRDKYIESRMVFFPRTIRETFCADCEYFYFSINAKSGDAKYEYQINFSKYS